MAIDGEFAKSFNPSLKTFQWRCTGLACSCDVTAPCMSGKALELEMSIAILVADHSHIAFIEEDGGQHPCKSSEDAVVV